MSKKRILIVDDESININIMAQLLEESYEVKVAHSGEKALEIAQKIELDLILLDIVMPHMSGYDVSKELKNNLKTQNIPIIFITSKTDEDSIEMAYNCGGSDYITKPIKSKELLARVERELKLKDTLLKLNTLNANLERVVIEKTQENIKQKEVIFQQTKQAAMGDLVGVIAHQLKQPLSSISLVSVIIKEDITNDEVDLNSLSKDIDRIEKSVHFMSDSIDDLRNFFRKDKIKKPFLLGKTVDKTLKLISNELIRNKIELETEISETLSLNSYENELQQVIINIVNNAKDAVIESRVKDPKIFIQGKSSENKISLEIMDNGGGIKEDILENIFDSYFTTKDEKGTGIGLNLSKMIIEESMGGKISAENIFEGAMFKIELPKE